MDGMVQNVDASRDGLDYRFRVKIVFNLECWLSYTLMDTYSTWS